MNIISTQRIQYGLQVRTNFFGFFIFEKQDLLGVINCGNFDSSWKVLLKDTINLVNVWIGVEKEVTTFVAALEASSFISVSVFSSCLSGWNLGSSRSSSSKNILEHKAETFFFIVSSSESLLDFSSTNLETISVV